MTDRLSVGLDSMASACALDANQAARKPGRPYVVREMLHTIVLYVPQPRNQYYMAQARLGLGRKSVEWLIPYTRIHHSCTAHISPSYSHGHVGGTYRLRKMQSGQTL